MSRPFAICGLLLVVAAALRAQILEPRNLAAFPRSYVAVRTTSPVVIDGHLDDSAWNRARWTENFVDIQGGSMPVPRFMTRVKMLWDDNCVYFGAEIEEPDVWATLTKRDTVIFHDNDFEVFIDPDGDNLEYMELEMNACNAVWDLLLSVPYRDGGHGDDSFNYAGLRTATSVRGTLNNPLDRDSGWTAEIAIPWAAFGMHAHRALPPRDGDQWRINFSRVEWRVTGAEGGYKKIPGTSEDNWVWSPQGVIDMHRPERWGYVQFSRVPAESVYADSSWDVRVMLMHVYYAERLYLERTGRRTASLDELGIPARTSSPRVVIQVNGREYTATLELMNGNRVVQRWHIRQDSRIWCDAQQP